MRQNGLPLLIGLVFLWFVATLPGFCQEANEASVFPQEDFTLINPTLPNGKLNFDDNSQESCCAKDYTPSGQPITNVDSRTLGAMVGKNNPAKSEFEKSNPRYIENVVPSALVSCDRFADLTQQASNVPASMNFNARQTLAIVSYSTNVSIRPNAMYATDAKMKNTSNFHIETAGGGGMLKLHDVNSYSVCMARGNNVAMVANTDNASILTYNGNDHIYLAGNNTNMLTRTGGGEDIIELHQAQPNASGGHTAWNIYKTAISGGEGEDTLVIKGTPVGTKWCHIGGYRIYGEYFYVVEFALPPSVTEGARRQRINIGRSVEFVEIKGKKYRLNEFLVHGAPVDTVAQSIPIGDPLPHVKISSSR